MRRWREFKSISALSVALVLAMPLHALDARVEIEARFDGEVARYGHNVLGDTPEWSQLCMLSRCVELPDNQIFEDLAPRMVDLDGDGVDEILVVQSQTGEGASLVVYDVDLKVVTQTPPIGTHNRWLAPIGAVDWDGDGKIEIAYVETPHLGRVLKIYEYDDRALELELSATSFSNHKIGDDFISSAVIDCEARRGFAVPFAKQASANLKVAFFEAEPSGEYDVYELEIDPQNTAGWEGVITDCSGLNIPASPISGL